MNYKFADKGPYTVTIEVMGPDGTVVGDSVVTLASPPANPADCASFLKVTGRFALLMGVGATSISTHYEAAVPRAIGSIESFTWTKIWVGHATADTIAHGADIREVEVSFGEHGDYEVSLELAVGNQTITTSRTVGVRTGEPVSEPGILVIYRRLPSDSASAVYHMDLETGLVDGPIFSLFGLGSGSGTACEPDGDRIVLSLNKKDEYGDWHGSNLWIVNAMDGMNPVRVTDTDRVTWRPSWSVRDEIAYVDDTRSGGPHDELYVISADGGQPVPLGGSTVNLDYVGFNPAWNLGGNEIALGHVRFPAPDGTVERRVAVIKRGNADRRPLHSVPFSDAYPGSYEVFWEGPNGLSWSPDGVWIAYDVILTDKSVPLYDSYYHIARARADGSGDVQELFTPDEVVSGIQYSLSGQHIYFIRSPVWRASNPDAVFEYERHIFQIPADGGEAVDLSAITDPDGDAQDFVGCMMPLSIYN